MKLLMSEWITPDDGGDGEKYKVRGLTGIEAVPVINFFRDQHTAARRAGVDFDPAALTIPAEIMRAVLVAGVEDWAGIEDQNGAPLAFSKELVELLSWDRLNYLVGEILDRSQISKDQEKNLSSPSKSKRKKKISTA